MGADYVPSKLLFVSQAGMLLVVGTSASFGDVEILDTSGYISNFH